VSNSKLLLILHRVRDIANCRSNFRCRQGCLS